MTILQGGAPKCGNFWLYQIIEEVLTKVGVDTRSFIQKHPIFPLARKWDLNYPSQASIDVLDITDQQTSYRISSIFRMPVEDLGDYVEKTNHVWTHSPICKASPRVFKYFEKKVYIVRDPRERALSAARYYCSDYMLKYFPQEETEPEGFLEKNFEQLMHEWVWHVFDHLRLSRSLDIHISFYESFLLDFQRELNRLLRYLETALSDPEKEALEEAVSFSRLKMENSGHLKKGKASSWIHELSEAQKEKAILIAGPLLQALNYTEINEVENALPHFDPSLNFKGLKQEILASQEMRYR